MRVLIIGLGSIAQKHIHVLREIFKDDIEIYALRSRRTSSSLDGIINLFAFEEITFRPDFIIISNNTNLHADTILKVAYLRCPLMIEKPVLHELKESAKILQVLEEFKIQTYCACNLRFHPAIQFLKSNLRKMGSVNEVNIYCGSFLPMWRQGADFRECYSANTNMGGGVHLDLIHEIDYTTWLFGLPSEMHSIKRSSSTLKINSVDFAQFNLIYEGFVATITLNYYRKDSMRSIEILFEDDTWYVDLIKCQILTSKNEIIFSSYFNMMDTYMDQMLYFLHHIKTGEEMMNSFKDSLKNLKLSLQND